MALFSNDKFKCARCGQKNEPLGYAPAADRTRTKRSARKYVQSCWNEWLEKQKQIINHFGLDVSNPDSHDFFFDQMKIFFYNEGVELAQIDTQKMAA